MDIVVKVKYGDTLRRFNSYMNGDSLDMDMDKLRAKVIDLFKLNPESDLTLTYVDEDDDIVTLVDDNDLHDAVLTQRLNPLRINVLLKNGRAIAYEARSQSGGASTPIQSPQVRSSPALHVSAHIEEAVKSLPEPLHDSVLKLSNDLLSKASASAPALIEFVEYLTKAGHSHLSPNSPVQDGSTLNKPTGDHNKPTGDQCPMLNIPVGSGVSDDPVSIPNLSANASSVGPADVPKNLNGANKVEDSRTKVLPGTSVSNASMSSNASSVDQFPADVLKNLNGANKAEVAATSVPRGTSVNLNLELLKDPHVSGCSFMDDSFTKAGMPRKADSEIQKESEGRQSVKSQPETTLDPPLVDLGHTEDSELRSPTATELNSHAYPMDSAHFWSTNSPGASGLEDRVENPGNWVWNYGFTDALRKGYSLHGSFPRAFHQGVRCDGCGMQPIMGPRFKSNVKEDYDLCNVCFSELGNEVDYTRIDRASYPFPRSRNPGRPTHLAPIGRPRPLRSKLESRFILDVNVLDGTLMPPGANFTKIWRMRNDGIAAWPHGTKLVYIGGDHFASSESVDLEIPESGYPVGGELDVAADFTAPTKPGRYASYWRMTSPSGQRFGQRVWVVIQVESPHKKSTPENHVTLNLNFPPEGSVIKGKEPAIIIDMNVEPKDGFFSEPDPDQCNVNAGAFGFEVAGDRNPVPMSNGTAPSYVPKKLPSSVPMDLPSSAGATVANPSSLPKDIPSSAGGVGVNLASVPKDIPASAGANLSPGLKEAALPLYPMIDSSASVAPAAGIDAFELTLLRELEEMGFKEKDLNKKILRKNEYDLAQSLDDLCGFSEWEVLLQDLEEMGFPDREKNVKLLKKNGGSIKRTVLDLISGEKA